MHEGWEHQLQKWIKPRKKWEIMWNPPIPHDPFAVIVQHFAPCDDLAKRLVEVPGVLAARVIWVQNPSGHENLPSKPFGFHLFVQKSLYNPSDVIHGIEMVLRQWEAEQEQINRMLGWTDDDIGEHFVHDK